MKKLTATVRDEDGNLDVITRDNYESKSAFRETLHRNGDSRQSPAKFDWMDDEEEDWTDDEEEAELRWQEHPDEDDDTHSSS